ncbi:MAG: DNA cytosine methyltransferase [Symbiobacteriia bacterium]
MRLERANSLACLEKWLIVTAMARLPFPSEEITGYYGTSVVQPKKQPTPVWEATAKMHEARMKKIARLKKGYKPRVADLFSGSGGISLGFKTAGFDILAGLEMDRHAAETHANNFYPDLSSNDRALHARPRDITKLEPDDFLKELYPKRDPAALVDIVVGGPPCQAFARVGRAKLREIAQHPEAFKLDPRGLLYLRYLHYVRALNPLAILLENVPDVVNYGGINVAEEIAEALEDLGYTVTYTFLNAANYGVPQLRERLILIAFADELNVQQPFFPGPTNRLELLPGYRAVRRVVNLGLVESPKVRRREIPPSPHFRPSPAADDTLPQAVTAEEALGDLPAITAHLEGRASRGPRRFKDLAQYSSKAPSSYAMLMRGWEGFESEDGTRDHVTRSLPRDYPIFRRMRPGHQYPEAYRIAVNLFEAELARRRAVGEDIPEGSEEFESLKAAIVPPYDPSKFPNKWRKIERDQPTRTLMAHLGKDSYSHIHYSDEQARTISVREAARLQSFPDGFKFSGAMNSAFRQIGNAVPPLLALRVAEGMKAKFQTSLGREIGVRRQK